MTRPIDERVADVLRPSAGAEAPLREREAEMVDAVRQALLARQQAGRPRANSRELTAVPARSGWRRAAVGLALAAGLGAIVVGTQRWWRDGDGDAIDAARVGAAPLAVVARAGGAQLLQPGDLVRGGDRLRVPAGGSASLQFPGGTQLAVSERTALDVVDVGAKKAFRLLEGSVRAQVHHLQAGERFVIEAELGRVEVRGTSFRVGVEPSSARCPQGALEVQVDEGLVVVSASGAEQAVGAGERTSLGCDGPAVAPVLRELAVEEDAGPQQVAAPPRARPASSLSRMNAAYARAMSLKRAGQLDEAALALEALRRDFPSGPLDEAAAVETLRILDQLDDRRARVAAQRYLDEFPNGYAREVAETMLAP